MKTMPFDIEKYGEGGRVVTRDNSTTNRESKDYPIVALVASTSGILKQVMVYAIEGKINSGESNKRDLFLECEWYEDIPKGGVVCKVRVAADSLDTLAIITEYKPNASAHDFKSSEGMYYFTAIPLPVEETATLFLNTTGLQINLEELT